MFKRETKEVKLANIIIRIDQVKDKLEELEQQRNQYRKILNKLCTEKLDAEISLTTNK